MYKIIVLASALYASALCAEPVYQKPLVAAGVCGASFFVVRYLKDQIHNNILARYIPYFSQNNLDAQVTCRMLATGIAYLMTIGIKKVIFEKLYHCSVNGAGDITGAPDWLKKAWLAGDTLALFEEGIEGANRLYYPLTATQNFCNCASVVNN